MDAPPIYIQEKIDPRAIIENLRSRSRTPASEDPQAALFDMFDDFDGIDDPLEAVDYYKHPANWANRMILGDSLQVMGSLAEKERLRGKVQMIYIDPPYGISFGSNWQVSTGKRDVRDGKAEDTTREVEQIKAFRDTWEKGINSYLAYLRDRLVVARDLLNESGSVFVQIGDENVHLVRSLLDEVFRSENFVSLISFTTTSGFQATTLARSGDYLLWYAKSINQVKSRKLWYRNEKAATSGYRWLRFPDGSQRGMTKEEISGQVAVPTHARLYTPDNLQSQNPASTEQAFSHKGKTYRPGKNSHWKASFPEGMKRLALAERVHVAKTRSAMFAMRMTLPISPTRTCGQTRGQETSLTTSSTSFRRTRRSSSGAC